MADEEEAGAAFIAAEGFAGAKEGYKFENGEQGVGYYKDVAPVSEVGIEELKKSQPVSKEGDVFDMEEYSSGDDQRNDEGIVRAFGTNFMGNSPVWYKQAIVACLFINVFIRFAIGKPACAWCVLIEFIFTLAMATNCYPLQPGGFVVIQAYVLGLAPASRLEYEVSHNIDIILLVVFMVACVHFLKNLLLWIFTNLLIKIKSKVLLSVGILLASAIMSAFMDALSVAAVLISVCSGVLGIYYQAVQNSDMPEVDASGMEAMSFELVPHTHGTHAEKVEHTKSVEEEFISPLAEKTIDGEQDMNVSIDSPGKIPSYHDTSHAQREEVMFPGAPMESGPKVVEPTGVAKDLHKEDIEEFRNFLRSVLMHGAVGTAVGGCTTLVGEPQNLVIAKRLDWDFLEFMAKMAPITIIVWPVAIVTCIALEIKGTAGGYGSKMPNHVRKVLSEFVDDQYGQLHSLEKAELIVQAIGAVLLVIFLCAHLTEVGFVGLAIAIIVTTMNGECEEHDIAHAFLEAMPFVSLLVVFFGVVAIIEEQHIFKPIIDTVLSLPIDQQPVALYLVNGVLSMVSDNVFVATIFIESVSAAYHETGPTASNMTHAHFEDLAVAINMGTNLPSCATPNGQAAFLFILTSTVAPLVQLSYFGMVKMTAPYTVTLSLAGLLGILTMDFHE